MREKKEVETVKLTCANAPATASARANLSSSYPALFTAVPLGFVFAVFDENPLLPPPTPVCQGGGRSMGGRDEDAGLPAHERTHLSRVLCVHPRLEVGPAEAVGGAMGLLVLVLLPLLGVARFELVKEECGAVEEEEGRGEM
jgi:hypothetical protein